MLRGCRALTATSSGSTPRPADGGDASSASPSRRRVRAEAVERLAIAALLFLVPAYLQRPALGLPPGHDQAIYLALGEGLLRGDLPYRDLWDHKPPGIYLVAALAALAPGPSWPVFWVLSMAAVGGTGLLLWRLTGGGLAALISVVVLSLLASPGHPETIAALPAAAALTTALARRGLASGAGLGVAALISPQYLAAAPAVAMLLGSRREILGGAAAAAAVGLLTVAGLAVAGVLPAAFDAVVVYNRAYLQLDRFGDLAQAAYPVLTVFLPVTLLAAWGALPPGRVTNAAVAWLLAAAALIAIQGRFFAHYLAPAALPLGLLLHRAGRAHMLVAAALVVGLRLLPAPSGGQDPRAASQAVGEWLRARAQPGATLLVWGFEVNTYLAAEMAPAHRFVYFMPLVTPGYTTRGTVEAFMRDLRIDPPTYLVDAEAGNPLWPDGMDFLRPPPPGTAGGRNLDLLEALRRFVANRYELLAEVAGRRIYRLATQSSGSGGG